MANVSSSNGLEKRPKLRFPGFDEPWEHKELLYYLVENTDRNKQLKFGKENVLSVSGEYGIVNQIAFQGRSFAGESVADYHVVETDDIVYTKSPLKANPYGIIKVNNGVPGIVSTLYAVYHPLKTVVPRFVDFYFSNDLRLNKFLKPLVNIGAKHDMKVNNTFVLTGMVVFPPLREQQKIVDFLTILDRRIDVQRKKVEALKKYKRGVMQRIFRQLPSQNGTEWTCVRLGDIFKKVSRRNTDGVIKNVITNSAEYGLIPQRDFFDKDIAVDGNTANYYVIENGDFVYNPRKSNSAPYGPFNRYTLSEQGIISPLYTCLVLQADISPSYLAWYFKSDAWYRYIYDNGSQGVRHDRVSMTDDLLMGIPVMYPSHVKQLLYADILDMVEARLQATQKTLDLLSKTRDGYMRQLFI
ncbi:restriction endonuclease subunit S [Butyricicoccus sp. AF22-28AC]|jgi:type I restriction enzyme S subunit|nr:restriction endonuclease subunit S [Butyricicoccus sp. AF22-28AC]RHQ83104.1 restriction endonuclease subunit S [Butyricicoccus sp. AF22-28AC]